MQIILGEEQKQAVDTIINFINTSPRTSFSLVGYAGTGKSTIIRWLVDHLMRMNIPYVLAAPTHKAKVAIKYTTGLEAMTIHQMLHLTPNIEIQNLDLKDLLFHVRKKSINEIPKRGVLICDESSMINDVLFKHIEESAEKVKTKVIFVGDSAQLKPVKSASKSLVFNLPDTIELTTIYRQSNESGLSTVLPTLRTSIIDNFETSIGKEGSLISVDSIRDLFKVAYPVFKEAIETRNIFKAKFYAYTNARTNAINDKIRELLFSDSLADADFYKGEILTFTDHYTYGVNEYFNSMDYIIDDVPEEINKVIPEYGSVDGYKLRILDTVDDVIGNVFVLHPKTSHSILDSLASTIENIRLEAIHYKFLSPKKAAVLWSIYYKITKSFATFTDLYYDDRVVKKKTFGYGYASTVHRSQGSTIENVFIDMKNVMSCRDILEVRQLQYVSISRASKNAYILQ
jgi:ATP-dependent exoDNAse (exonuclease V) alpha subunit